MPVRQDRKQKTWFYRFSRAGKSYFKGGFRTKAFAKEAEAANYDQVVAESLHPERKGQNLLFKDAVEWYLSTFSINKRTVYIDKARLGLAAKFFDSKKVSEIQPEDVEAFLKALSPLRAKETPRLKGIKDQTKNHYLTLLRTFYNRLSKRKKWVGENPALGVDSKKVPRARVRWLLPSEQKQLSPIVAQVPEVWAYYFMALHTGLRIRELMGIRVKDVDPVLGQIFIPNSKNHRSRHIPLSPNAQSYVTTLIKGKSQEAKLLPNRSYSYIRSHFMALVKLAAIDNFTIHDMRHTFAQRLLSMGESIYHVSKLLGHSSVAVTQAHYGHLSASDLSNTASRIDGIVSCSQVAVESLQLSSEEAKIKLINPQFSPG